MSSRRGSFAELVALAERAGHSEVLPALASAGVRDIAGLAADTDRLVEAGISPVTLEALLAAPPPAEATSELAVVTAGPSRPDLPFRRDATRASLAAAVEAVRPANVKRAVTELRDNMLAKSTRGPYESRLRTWNRLAFEGRVPAWPITTRTLEVIGAAFRAGAYRSAKEYFLAAFRYQEHDLRIEVDPLLRRFANRVIKAIVRGLPGSRLKEAFPLPALTPLVNFADRAAFDPERAAHSVDVFVLAVWFMLREIEVAAARVRDMVVSPGLLVLDLPLHKTAMGGERTLTRRSLRCACGAATHPLCPVHAAMRHLVRLGAAGLLASAGPLFPGKGGGTRSKEESVAFLRGVLEAAGLTTTYQDANGIERQVFGGHACRVAGATFLAAKGIPMAVIQLLGRWSSRAIERYTQSAPLALAPSARCARPSGHRANRAGRWGTAGCPTRLGRRHDRRGSARRGGGTVGCPGSAWRSPTEECGAGGWAPGGPVRPGSSPREGGP